MIAKGPAETEALGQNLGSLLKGGEVIELSSDLGGGKTTFVKGLVRGMGSTSVVASPSFTLSKIYLAKNGLAVHHYDFYRLGKKTGVVTNQLSESLNNQKVITVVEWGGGVGNILPPSQLKIKFQPVAGKTNQRTVSFEYSEEDSDLIKKLEINRTTLKQ